ncbi:LANO_0G16974g1_1 [Lachancea nothofagi CBS 11611]|uniref:LANO_0G16974g1_1 n=1 Tax=Lachancea nothofagi CBS 11611 TaxID=1266666 RepID=A0A1G4KKU3_9SACH|nr:LANO_0G16974g1_1 [Lachancea nothofagi CBS 11611]
MADPFADLFSTFKGSEKTNICDKRSVSNINDAQKSSRSMDAGRNTPTEIDRYFNSKPDAVHSRNTKDELDEALDVFNTPVMQSPVEITPELSVDSQRTADVVDELKDMEIAKLMSLGMSFRKALDYYERGILYERVLEQQKRKSTAKSSSNNSAEEADLFSVASSWINKGRTFLDSSFKKPSNPGAGSYSGYISSRSNSNATPAWSKAASPIQRSSSGSSQSVKSSKYASWYSDKEHTSDEPQLPPRPSAVRNTNDLQEQINASDTDAYSNSLVALDANVEKQLESEVLLDFETFSPPKVPATSNNNITSIELHGYQEFKAKASDFFVAGDYDLALQNYEKSLNTLPPEHPWRTVSLSNMIVCQLKLGQYRHALQSVASALNLIPLENIDQKIPDLIPAKTFKEIWSKITINKAEALERIEDYANALATYQLLITKGFTSDKILEARRRCQRVVAPQKFTPSKTKASVRPVKSEKPAPIDKTSENSKFVQAQNKQARELEQQRFLLHDDVQRRVAVWSEGNENNLRELLARLHLILDWCDWRQVPSSALVMPKKVKFNYLKAAAKTHPDKIQLSWPLEQQMIAENIFIILSKAWESFQEQNKIT